jgi:hypothetical protein
MKAVIIFITALFFLYFTNPVLAANLLSNPGFEDGLSSWTLSGSTATFSAVFDLKHEGNASVKISKENASSWAYFYQRIPVEAGKYYKLSGWLRLNDESIANGKLRFYWLSDSAGTKVSSDPVEITLTSKNSDFQLIETNSIISPDQSTFVEVQGYIYLNQKSPATPLLFDDLVFENVQPTPTPTPTPTSSPTNTPTPAPTSSPTNIPTPTKTPTPTPVKSPTPTSESDPMAPSMPENTVQSSVLGENAGGELGIPSPDNNLIPGQTKKPDTVFQWTIMLLGIALIAICVIFTIRIIKKGELGQDEKE